jgi:hypothetical protein
LSGFKEQNILSAMLGVKLLALAKAEGKVGFLIARIQLIDSMEPDVVI